MRQTIGDDYKIFGPVEVIKNLNAKMIAQKLDGCLFATCCYCLLNVRTLQLTYCRAGHPYPVLVKKGLGPEQLESRGGLLGTFDDIEFEQNSVQLESGDKVFLYSDGVESLVGQQDESSEFVFSKSFRSILTLPIEQMMSKFEIFVKNNKVQPCEVDDSTAIGLEIL